MECPSTRSPRSHNMLGRPVRTVGGDVSRLTESTAIAVLTELRLESFGEICAICALPAANGGSGAAARCTECSEIEIPAAPLSMRDALSRTLRDALVEASGKASIPCWPSHERPEQTLQDNLRDLRAGMQQTTARCGDVSAKGEKPPSADLTARDVARVVCIGAPLVTAARVLGGAQLSAPLSRTVRIALLACESTGGSAAAWIKAFASAVEKLRAAAADADTPITLASLCGAVCTPLVLELAEAALRPKREGPEATASSCTDPSCDCGGVMGGGFL